jgi:transposase
MDGWSLFAGFAQPCDRNDRGRGKLPCTRFAVGVSTVVKWRRRWLDTGTAAAKPMGGATNTRIKGEDAAWLLALVAAQDDLTLHAMQARLRKERGVTAAIGSIWRFLRANKITLKKRR